MRRLTAAMSVGQSESPINLAREEAFALGDLEVRPPTRELMVGGQSHKLEPRVMQVLVALARRRGEVVSRDELIARCWVGRTVSEDAINRCIGSLRRLAQTHGGFQVHTVTRVGYRLEADKPNEGAAERSAEPLLAVLAFDNLSGDADMSYFSDGISEEILHLVARGGGLRVIGRGSSFQFRGSNKSAAHVAAALKATHVLDGSVRRSGTRVRVSANLVECAGQTTLWSDRFDRELSDTFAIQDEIAGAVASALKIALAPRALPDAIDPAAYNLYLRALEIRNKGLEPDTRQEVIKLLEGATRLVPKFARAWVFLATMLAGQFRFEKADQADNSLPEKILFAAETALRLDPTLGGAYQAIGLLEPFAQYEKREALHRKALAVAPNDPTVLTNASLFFTETGMVGEALELGKRAYELDPMYPWVANWYGQLLGYAGRFEECRALVRRLCALWPGNELIIWNGICVAGASKDWGWFDFLEQSARERHLLTSSVRVAIDNWGIVRRPETRSHYLTEARAMLAQNGALPLHTYWTLFLAGMKDETFELVDQTSFVFMFDFKKPSPSGSVAHGSIFAILYCDALMRDVRFVRLCSKLALCDYWLETGKWPDCAAEGVLPYDFKAECARARRPNAND